MEVLQLRCFDISTNAAQLAVHIDCNDLHAGEVSINHYQHCSVGPSYLDYMSHSPSDNKCAICCAVWCCSCVNAAAGTPTKSGSGGSKPGTPTKSGHSSSRVVANATSAAQTGADAV